LIATEQAAVVAGDRTLGVGEFLFARQQGIELVGGADRRGAFAGGIGMGDVEQQVLGQVGRRRNAEAGLAGVDQALDLAVDLAEQQLDRRIGLDRTGGDALEHAGGNPPQATGVFLRAGRAQAIEHLDQARELRRGGIVANPAQQGKLERRAQACRLGLEFEFRRGLPGGAGGVGQRCGQVRREQHRFGEQFLAARRAQVVQQRQQDDRDVLVSALQAFQVIGQLHDAAHEHGIAVVLGLHLAVEQGQRDAFHFLHDHGRAIQLDHAQGALHLVQVGRAEAHQARVGRILDVGLERLARLLEGFVEFLLHPIEGGEVDVVVLQLHGLSLNSCAGKPAHCDCPRAPVARARTASLRPARAPAGRRA
jgi:hypothetical protein